MIHKKLYVSPQVLVHICFPNRGILIASTTIENVLEDDIDLDD